MLFFLTFLCFSSKLAFSLNNGEGGIDDMLKRYVLSVHEEYKQHIEELQSKFENRLKLQDERIQTLQRDLSEKTKLVELLNIKLNNVERKVALVQSQMEKNTVDHNTLDGNANTSSVHYVTQRRNGTLTDTPPVIHRQERILYPGNAVQSSNVIAFYAYMSANLPASQAVANHVLVFNVAKTNIGNAYHPHTGIFIVPEAGVYVFSWNLFNGGQNIYHSLQLVVNSDVWGDIHSHTLGGDFSESTGIVVVQANEGDDVFVRISPASSNGDITSNIYGKTFFAGWKL